MSRVRHRAKGGKIAVYAGEDSNVLKEAHKRKRGGRLEAEGEEAPKRADKRARGGAVASAVAPGRKRGGGVGSNERPLSTAASTKKLSGEIEGGPKGSEVSNP